MAQYIAVVGGANVDICGTPDSHWLSGDSNPGHIAITPGGVGRNIAENLARLGQDVRLITAFGDDEHGRMLREKCAEAGIGIEDSLTFAGAATSSYLCLNDVDGDVLGAVSDMAILDRMTPQALESRLPLLQNAALVVLDANLPAQTLRFLVERVSAPIFADPVSVKKAGRFAGLLGFIQAMKPNRAEASLLCGVDIRTEEDLRHAAEAFFHQGLRQVIISLGGRGVYYNDGQADGILPCLPMPVQNTTGCGDAFLAAAALAYLESCSLRDMARWGLASSALCAQSGSAVNPNLNWEALSLYLRHNA